MSDLLPDDPSGAAAGQSEPWFPAQLQGALLDFWLVYDKHCEALDAALLRFAQNHPELRRLGGVLSSEQMQSERRRSRERMYKVAHGDFAPYIAHVKQQGKAYARLGMQIATWHELSNAFHAELIPYLVQEYAATPSRLSAVLVAVATLLSRAMATVGEQYIKTKSELLSEMQQRHALILNASVDPILALDDGGRLTEFNAAAERTFGYQRAAVLGQRLTELIIPERFRAEREAELAAALENRGPLIGQRVEWTARRADGSELTLEVAMVAHKTAEGRYVLKGFLRDLTAQKKAEESQALWNYVLELAQFGICAVDAATGRIYAVNNAYARMVGFEVAELVGRPAVELLPQAARANVDAIRAVIDQAGHLVFEQEILRKDGTLIPMLFSSSLLPPRPGRPTLRVGTATDISDRKELEQERARAIVLAERSRRVEEASRLKSEFLASMSHELRTPLNAIIGFSELMYDGKSGPLTVKQKEFLGHVLVSGQHLLQLINDVLDLAKVEAGKLDFYPERLDLAELIAEVTTVLQPMAESRQVHMQSTISPALGAVVLDAARLKQVLYNYTSNALKFTAAGGQVMIRAWPAGSGWLRLEVEDTGIGISEEDCLRLFSEFTQLDSGAGKRHQGSGLGLALTRRLVEAQGGTVGVTSTLGVGSTFFAELPLQADSSAPRVGRRGITPPDPNPSTRVVVEDDPRDQELIVSTLAAAGYAVEAVATGADAIASCRERAFDAVTLDILLPDTTGLEVVKVLRHEGKRPDVPVVVITIVSEKLIAGLVVQDVLPKPIEPASLLTVLARFIPPTSVRKSVMVIDDDAASLRLMAATLEELGFSQRCFQDARSALAAIELETPTVVILDLLMPDMDGIAFLHAFRALDQCRDVAVLVWTIKDLSSQEHAQLMKSAQAIIQKGRSSRGSLLAILAEHLARLGPGR